MMPHASSHAYKGAACYRVLEQSCKTKRADVPELSYSGPARVPSGFALAGLCKHALLQANLQQMDLKPTLVLLVEIFKA